MSGLSETQLRYLANAWKCFENEPKVSIPLHQSSTQTFLFPQTLVFTHTRPHLLLKSNPPNPILTILKKKQIDYEKFAALSNLKSAASGREMLRQTKKKLLENASGADSATSTFTSTAVSKKSTTAAASEKKGVARRIATTVSSTAAARKRGRVIRTPDSDGRSDDDDGDDDGDDEEVIRGGSVKKIKTGDLVFKDEPKGEDDAEGGNGWFGGRIGASAYRGFGAGDGYAVSDEV